MNSRPHDFSAFPGSGAENGVFSIPFRGIVPQVRDPVRCSQQDTSDSGLEHRRDLRLLTREITSECSFEFAVPLENRYGKGFQPGIDAIPDPLVELLAKQSDDGHYLQYLVCGTKGVLETDVFKRRLRRFEFSEVSDGMDNNIVETITFPKEEDKIYFHNTHGQNLRVIELAAKGLQPEVSAEDAFETMRLCFAAEKSEDTGKIIRMDELPTA